MDTILQLAIEEASKLYGKPIHSRTILPIKFRTFGGPDCTFPTYDTIQVTVRNYCQSNNNSAYYQISHEAIHTLSPTDKNNVTFLEEGVATRFSHDFLFKHTGTKWISSEDPLYDEAWELVNKLVAVEDNAISILFSKYRTLSDLTAQNIIDEIPAVSQDLADRLATKFYP
ncbi:hypothetical protein TUM17384_20140 [Shewanella algae]|uniref:hypothetical protein n=1 Tax=Shewanella algae TaxID=38313 RepID=UPI001BEE23F1|nr:hypothetical protein [Shewanella algae]BCV58069.1 hypothetical protein TUM17384_20140 [Shewanella algae]